MEQKQSVLFDIVSKTIVKSVLKGLITDSSYIEGKAKQLCYCNNSSKRDALINSIYNKCESDIRISDSGHLLTVLNDLKQHSAYVCNVVEFWRLYHSLFRFTHSTSFFSVCTPIITATLSTLITLILSNKLIYAAEMIEGIETYLFETQKPLCQDLIDLLDMKYGLVNLVQYRLLPILLGESESVAGSSGGDSNSNSDSAFDYHQEAEQLLSLPVKTNIVSDVYSFLISKGIGTANNQSEYSAGLKIEDITQESSPNQQIDKLPTLITSKQNIATTTNKSVTTNTLEKVLSINNKMLSKEKLEECSRILDKAQQYSKGRVLDGTVTSPLTDTSVSSFIPLSLSDMNKFTVLEYLYVMRVLANCVKKKNDAKSGNRGVTLNINSPFKVISVPHNK